MKSGGSPAESGWLFVPWHRIENLRLSTQIGDDGGTCVAFDVRVPRSVHKDLFDHVGEAVDGRRGDSEVVFAAYDDVPPSPRRTLARLRDLQRVESQGAHP